MKEVGKPGSLRPIRSHQGELCLPRFPEFRQNSGNDGPRRKRVGLKTVPGTEVIHVTATGFQGIPDCVARYKFPRIWRRLNQYQRLLGASIPMGSVIYTRVAWVTASDWNTGVQSSHGVINLHFVYTLVTVLVCL